MSRIPECDFIYNMATSVICMCSYMQLSVTKTN